MKKSVLLFFAALSAISVITTSCNKNEDDDEDPIIVSAPIITSSRNYFYCTHNTETISWFEPEVSGELKSKFTYQFMISDDDGASWKSFVRQEMPFVKINKDVKYDNSKLVYSNLNHNALPVSDNIPLNYLDSLNSDILYQYKIRAYYANNKSEEEYVDSDIAKFYLQIINKKVYTIQVKDDLLEVTWNLPKNGIRLITVCLTNDSYRRDDYTFMIDGILPKNDYLLNNFYFNSYYNTDLFEKGQCEFPKPKPGYAFDELVFSVSPDYNNRYETIEFCEQISWYAK